MRNELEKFNHTVSILVKAYLNDTLEHCNCAACAVGNIIADANGDVPLKILERRKMGLVFDTFKSMKRPEWFKVFVTPFNGARQDLNIDKYIGEAKRQIDSTGYFLRDLAKIEHAFESADYGNDDNEWMFNGLMAVVTVLAEIHGVDLESTENAKLLFVK